MPTLDLKLKLKLASRKRSAACSLQYRLFYSRLVSARFVVSVAPAPATPAVFY